MKKNIGIIFGGNSVEHEISIITAMQAIENIDQNKYNPIPIYLSKDNKFYSEKEFKNIEVFKDLKKLLEKYKEKIIYKDENGIHLITKKKSFFKGKEQISIDVFLPIVHGTNVEDGKLQGFLETMNLPYIGTTTTSGVIGQDKSIMKDILKGNNIDQTNYLIFDENDIDNIKEEVQNKLGFPVIIKPACLGSSIGINIANSTDELMDKINNSFKYDQTIVIEEKLSEFKEINISVRKIKNKILTSAIEEVNVGKNILTYEDKYLKGSKTKGSESSGMASLDRKVPAELNDNIEKKIEEIATKTYKILKCEGIIRIDLLLYNDRILVNEINNIPGSLSFYLWEANGIKYKELLNDLIEDGIISYTKRKNKNFSFTTNVLNMNGKKIKK